MKITERNLPTLSPGEYRDDQLPGFLVRITRTHRHFEIRYSHRGKQERLLVGNAKLMPIGEARENARQLLAANKRGEDPRAQTGRRTGTTIAQLGTEYFAWATATNAFRTIDERKRIWARNIEPAFGRLDTTHLLRARIREWSADLVARYSGHVANRAFSLLSSVFRWAVRRDLIETTPFYLLEAPFAGETSRTRYLSREELAALMAALNELPCGLSDLVRLLVLTGVRRSTASLATWSEVDGDLWMIPAARMKSDRPHDVPLSPQARAVFDRQRERTVGTTSSVFPLAGSKGIREREDASISHAYLRRIRKHVEAHLGHKPAPWTIHDLRRTVATHLENVLGVRRDVVAAILSHASGSRQTRIYALGELFPERRVALKRWAEWLDELTPAHEELLNPTAAAARVGLTRHTLAQYRSGKMRRLGPDYIKAGNLVLYRASVIEAWRQSRQLAQGLPRCQNEE